MSPKLKDYIDAIENFFKELKEKYLKDKQVNKKIINSTYWIQEALKKIEDIGIKQNKGIESTEFNLIFENLDEARINFLQKDTGPIEEKLNELWKVLNENIVGVNVLSNHLKYFFDEQLAFEQKKEIDEIISCTDQKTYDMDFLSKKVIKKFKILNLQKNIWKALEKRNLIDRDMFLHHYLIQKHDEIYYSMDNLLNFFHANKNVRDKINTFSLSDNSLKSILIDINQKKNI